MRQVAFCIDFSQLAVGDMFSEIKGYFPGNCNITPGLYKQRRDL
jgi:hypothetical protein